MSGWALPAAILAVAILYATVGHAGATGYIAVMGLLGLAPEVIRPTALVLNLVVAAIGTVQFARAGHVRRDLLVPLAIASVPAAAVGGAMALPTAVFEGLLGLVLACSAVRIVREVLGSGAAAGLAHEDASARRRLSVPLLAAIGAGLGLAAGLTGVGGGVFLTPLLLALGLATTRQVAAVSVVFILVNSAAGLGGWLASGRSLAAIDPWVVVAAATGGLVGSQAGAFQLPVRWLRLLMAVVLAVASVKLLAAGGEKGVRNLFHLLLDFNRSPVTKKVPDTFFSVGGGFRKEVQHHHARHDQAHAGDRCRVELLTQEEPADRRDECHAHPRPDGVGDADGNGGQRQRQEVEGGPVAHRHHQAGQGLCEPGRGLEEARADHLGHDRDHEIHPGCRAAHSPCSTRSRTPVAAVATA